MVVTLVLRRMTRMMSNYVIRWPIHTNNTYSYGSVINYQNGKVYFKNERMSPGERIHSWQSKLIFGISNSEFSQLPLLKRGIKYRITTKAKVIPEESIQVQLDFFDVRDEIIDGPLTINLNDEFVIPEELDHYRLSLVNLNNKELEFENLVIKPAESNFETETITGNINVTCVWDKRDSFFEDVEVYLRGRLVYSGSYLGRKNTLRIFVEFDNRANWQNEQLREEISKAISSLEKVIKKNKMAFDALSPNIILLSSQTKANASLEKYTTIELSKLLHFYRR